MNRYVITVRSTHNDQTFVVVAANEERAKSVAMHNASLDGKPRSITQMPAGA